MRIAVAALAVLALPTITACSSTTPGSVAPTDAPTRTAVATPAPYLTSAPTTPPVGDLLTFDQAAAYPDGLSVQVEDVVATSVPEGVAGAEGTGGEVVLADVVVTNATPEPYDATRIVVQGYYRGTVGAVMLSDPSGTIGVGFATEVPAGGQHMARVGFAIPAAEAGDVTIVVDPRDPAHGPVRFQGAAVGD